MSPILAARLGRPLGPRAAAGVGVTRRGRGREAPGAAWARGAGGGVGARRRGREAPDGGGGTAGTAWGGRVRGGAQSGRNSVVGPPLFKEQQRGTHDRIG